MTAGDKLHRHKVLVQWTSPRDKMEVAEMVFKVSPEAEEGSCEI